MMRRYEKEVKLNMSHMETITELNVSKADEQWIIGLVSVSLCFNQIYVHHFASD